MHRERSQRRGATVRVDPAHAFNLHAAAGAKDMVLLGRTGKDAASTGAGGKGRGFNGGGRWDAGSPWVGAAGRRVGPRRGETDAAYRGGRLRT